MHDSSLHPHKQQVQCFAKHATSFSQIQMLRRRAHLLCSGSLDLLLGQPQLTLQAIGLRQQGVYPAVELLGRLNLEAGLQQRGVPQRLSVRLCPFRLLVLLYLPRNGEKLTTNNSSVQNNSELPSSCIFQQLHRGESSCVMLRNSSESVPPPKCSWKAS